MSKEEFMALIDEVQELFVTSEGGSCKFIVDGKEYLTDTGYALDGIKFFTEVLKEKLNH